jgi:hypothetical protein
LKVEEGEGLQAAHHVRDHLKHTHTRAHKLYDAARSLSVEYRMPNELGPPEPASVGRLVA